MTNFKKFKYFIKHTHTHPRTHTHTHAHIRTYTHTRTHTQCNLYCLNDKAHTFEIYYNTHTHTHTHTHTLSSIHWIRPPDTSRPLQNFGLHHLQKIHLQKLLGPSVCCTTAGGAPDVAPALGVAQQSELPHTQTTHRHHSSPCGPWSALESRTIVVFWRD